MDFIDEEARDHFRYLQQSIGQNFASVLNNPRESETRGWGETFFGRSTSETPPPLPPLCTFPVVTVDAFTGYFGKVEQLLGTFNAYHRNLPAYREDVERQRIDGLPGIPAEFFSDTFDFFKSESFGELAKAHSSAARPPVDEKVLHDYLETVEIALFKQVRARSDQFFQALSAFHTLRKGVTDACVSITALRDRLAAMDQTCVRQTLEVANFHQRKAQMAEVLELIETVQSVRQVPSQVRLLLNAGDYIAALDAIDATVDSLKGELAAVVALRPLQHQLMEVRGSAARAMQAEFLRLILADTNASPNAFAGPESSVRMQLTPLVYGLVRSGVLQATLQAFKEQVVERAKKTVNDAITNSLELLANQPGFPTTAQVQAIDADPSPGKKRKPTSLAIRQISLLELDHFLFLINQVFESASILLQATGGCTEALLALVAEATAALDPANTAATSAPPSPTVSTSFGAQLLLETLRDTRVNVTGIVHSRIIRLFDVRAARHDGLRLDDLATLLRAAFAFGSRCDALFAAGPAVTTLHSTLVSQTKSFFLRQHERHLQKLGAILAQEQWKHEKEVEPSFQRVVDELTVVDAEGVAKALERRVDPKPDPAAPKVPQPDLLPSPDLVPAPQFLQPPDVPRQSLLSIANRGYPVGASVLLLVQLLGEYDRCLMTFPYIAVDILQRVHDLLKAYDSQASRLVLGAAAIETAGLKSITTYHLALAAQSLSFVRTLVAFLRARYLGLLPPRHAVFVSNMFDRLCKDITAHRAEFDMKIVGIMCDRLTGSPELAIDPSKWADHGSAHIRALVAEIGRLWKVLKQYFHLDQTQAIFVETVKHYNAHLRDVFLRMPLEDSGLRERVAGDVKNYRVNIERFGIAVLPGDTSLNTEDAILAYFLGPREAPCSP